MSKAKKPRPIVPCWYCRDTSLVLVHNDLCFGDVRDRDWYVCAVCCATTQENPIKLGPPIKGVKYYTKTMPLLTQCLNPSGKYFQHEAVRFMGWERQMYLTMKILKDWGCDLQGIAGVSFPYTGRRS